MTRGVTSKGVPWVSADEVFDEWDRSAVLTALDQKRGLQAMHDLLVWLCCEGCAELDQYGGRQFIDGFEKGYAECAMNEGN